jgi:hypothetical protein
VSGVAVIDDPAVDDDLLAYFPAPIRERLPDACRSHRLRREIVATVVTNALVNRAGIAFASSVEDATGADWVEIARAWLAARDIFRLDGYWAAVEALDGRVAAGVQTGLLLTARALVEAAMPHLLAAVARAASIGTVVAHHMPGAEAVEEALAALLPADQGEALAARVAAATAAGVPEDLARRAAAFERVAAALPITDRALAAGQPIERVARLHFAIDARFRFDRLMAAADAIADGDAWARRAAAAARDDLAHAQNDLLAGVLGTGQGDAATALAAWSAAHAQPVQRIDALLAELDQQPRIDLAMLTVATRSLRAASTEGQPRIGGRQPPSSSSAVERDGRAAIAVQIAASAGPAVGRARPRRPPSTRRSRSRRRLAHDGDGRRRYPGGGGLPGGEAGSGTYVAALLPADRLRASPGRPDFARPDLSAAARCWPRQSGSLGGRLFTPGLPALDAFPLAEWRRALGRAQRAGGTALLHLADPRGWPPLRHAIADYVGPARGVACSADQVVVLASARQAVSLAGNLLADPGDRVWVEDPGYPDAHSALRAAGLVPVPVPVDHAGLDVAAGRRMAPDARLAAVTPSHQYPLGHIDAGTPRRPARLGTGGVGQLEDDYDGEFRYGGRPITAVRPGWRRPRPLCRQLQQGDVPGAAPRLSRGAAPPRRRRRRARQAAHAEPPALTRQRSPNSSPATPSPTHGACGLYRRARRRS